MKKTWSVNQVEIIPVEVSNEDYNQLLAEMGEMVYRYFCQLSDSPNLAPETETALTAERTGTDG
jgi:hypothetical protein